MQVAYEKSRFSTNIWPITAGSDVPSTLGRWITGYSTYASDCVDRWRAIHKCRSATHQWRSRLSQMLLQKYSKCNIFLLISNSPWGLPPRDLYFLSCDAIHKRSLLCGVRLSVRLSRSCILSKRMNIGYLHHNFHLRVATPFKFFYTKRYDNIRRGPPIIGAKSRFSTNIWLWHRSLLDRRRWS